MFSYQLCRAACVDFLSLLFWRVYLACANTAYNGLVCVCTYLNLLDVHITAGGGGGLRVWVRAQRRERREVEERSEIKKGEGNCCEPRPLLAQLTSSWWLCFCFSDSNISTSWIFYMDLVHECTSWVYIMDQLHEYTLWIYFMILLHECTSWICSTSWIYFVALLHGSTSWFYFVNTLHGSTSWIYLVDLLHGWKAALSTWPRLVILCLYRLSFFFMFMEVLSERKYKFKGNASLAFVI